MRDAFIRELRRDESWRQMEDGILQYDAETAKNRLEVKVNGRGHNLVGLGGTWLDADNQAGETVRIAHIQGNPYLPQMITRGSKPGRIVVSDEQDLLWTIYRQDYERTNCLAGDFVPLEEPVSELNFTALMRTNEVATYEFRGSALVNQLGGAVAPWKLFNPSAPQQELEVELFWLDFSILPSGNFLVLASRDPGADLYFGPVVWPESPAYSEEQQQVLIEVTPGGQIVAEFVSEVRAIEYPEVDPGGGGDPGGGDGGGDAN